MSTRLDSSEKVLSYLSESLRVRIADTIDLALEHIDVATKAEAAFLALAPKQVEVLDALNGKPCPPYSAKFYEPKSYRNELDFQKYIRDAYSLLVGLIVDSINKELGTTFVASEKSDILDSFVENGLDMSFIYADLAVYLDGRNPKDVQRDEALEAMYKRCDNRWSDDELNGISVSNRTLIINNFVQKDSWRDGMSSYAYESIRILGNYAYAAANVSLTFMNAPLEIGYGEAFEPVSSLQSGVKSIRAYKNGNLKMVFTDADGLEKFLEPLREKAVKVVAEREANGGQRW